MGGKCRPGAWLVQGSPRPCAPLNVQCPSSPATSTPHPSCIAVCDGSVIDPRQTINCNANAAKAEPPHAHCSRLHLTPTPPLPPLAAALTSRSSVTCGAANLSRTAVQVRCPLRAALTVRLPVQPRVLPAPTASPPPSCTCVALAVCCCCFTPCLPSPAPHPHPPPATTLPTPATDKAANFITDPTCPLPPSPPSPSPAPGGDCVSQPPDKFFDWCAPRRRQWERSS